MSKLEHTIDCEWWTQYSTQLFFDNPSSDILRFFMIFLWFFWNLWFFWFNTTTYATTYPSPKQTKQKMLWIWKFKPFCAILQINVCVAIDLKNLNLIEKWSNLNPMLRKTALVLWKWMWPSNGMVKWLAQQLKLTPRTELTVVVCVCTLKDK